MLPPFSGIDLVKVMRREMDVRHQEARNHLPFEAAEDFEQNRSGDQNDEQDIRGIRRLLQFAFFAPGRTKT